MEQRLSPFWDVVIVQVNRLLLSLALGTVRVKKSKRSSVVGLSQLRRMDETPQPVSRVEALQNRLNQLPNAHVVIPQDTGAMQTIQTIEEALDALFPAGANLVEFPAPAVQPVYQAQAD